MKKKLTVLLLILALMLTMAGCSAVQAVQKLDAAEDIVEAKLDAVENQVESTILEAVSPIQASATIVPDPVPAPTSAVAAPDPVETLPTPAENLQKLTEEQAQQVALQYLSLTADQVTRLRSKYEIDDRIPQYDVEFLQGDWENEFEIHGETGQILSYDKDHKYD